MASRELNVFTLLAKHIRRHDENYLTQSLAAVFNNSARFRSEMAHHLAFLHPSQFSHLREHDPRDLWMDTQLSHADESGALRNILDAVILNKDKELVAIEAKLAAPIQAKQLRTYHEALRRLRLRCPLVLVALAPSVSRFPAALRQDVRTVSWLAIYKMADRARSIRGHGSYEKGLLEAFMGFLVSSGVVAPDPLSSADWGRVVQLGRLLAGPRSNADFARPTAAFNAVASASSRLELHRDEEWNELADAGWTPSSLLTREGPASETDDSFVASLIVGYYKRPRRARVQQTLWSVWFAFELLLSNDGARRPPRLSIYWYRFLKRDHPELEAEPMRIGAVFAPREVRSLFAQDFDRAHELLQPQMRRALLRFKSSAAWQAVR